MKDSFCSYCGNTLSQVPYPRQCSRCNEFVWNNPKPVANVLVPVHDGVLLVKRAHSPGRGEWALPGGYIDEREHWEEAAAREVLEETGIEIDSDLEHLLTVSAPASNTVLIFGLTKPLEWKRLSAFEPNEEVSDIRVCFEPEELAFSSHTQAVASFFNSREENL